MKNTLRTLILALAATTAATATTFADPHNLTFVYPESPLDGWLWTSTTGPYEGFATWSAVLPWAQHELELGHLIGYGYQSCTLVAFNTSIPLCGNSLTYYPGHDGGDVNPLDNPGSPTVPEPGPCGTILMGALFLGLKYRKRGVR